MAFGSTTAAAVSPAKASGRSVADRVDVGLFRNGIRFILQASAQKKLTAGLCLIVQGLKFDSNEALGEKGRFWMGTSYGRSGQTMVQ
jgi:hypothetical protein